MTLKHKQKKKLSKAQMKKRQQRRMQLSALILTVVCACGIAMMYIVNSEPASDRYTYTQQSDLWYVEGGKVEVASAQAEEFQFVFTTPEPVQVTVEPEPSPDPEATVKGYVPTPEPTRAPATITITATGDVTLGTYMTRDGSTSNFRKFYQKYGDEYFFANFKELFEQDDLTIINLEGPLTKYNEKRPRRTFNFRGYPEYVGILTYGSVEICNMANNHALDYQENGFKDTYANLTAAGIGASGYGPEYFTEVNGYTVGSLGFTEWNFEEKDILASVYAASQKCDLLIVSMHWNEEHNYSLSKYCRKMGQALIDAGADLVIGNHSHVIGEIEKYNGKYIINSLGNFCFGGNDDPYVRECTVFRQTFLMTNEGVQDGGIDLIPALISSTEDYNDFQPRIATPEEGKEIVYAIGSLSKNLPAEDILWLPEGYVVRNGIIPGTTPVPEGAQQAAAASGNTDLPLDIPMDNAR